MSNDTNDSREPRTAERTSPVQHSWEEPFEPSVTIVEAVAAATDRRPTGLPPLQNYIDPDALDALVTRGESAQVVVSFDYAGTVVVVEGDGTIEIHTDAAEE